MMTNAFFSQKLQLGDIALPALRDSYRDEADTSNKEEPNAIDVKGWCR
jgi:hypothetical protein